MSGTNGSPTARAHPAPELAPGEVDLAVFRSGDYGARGRYTHDDLDRLAADYDPGAHEAPLTIDHEERGPAHGWVRALRRDGDLLVARVAGLSRFIRGALANGTYRKPSVELFTRHPVTGDRRLGLRAVSLLGSMVPRVKGLPALSFSELSELVAQDDATLDGDAIGATLVLPAPSALLEPVVALDNYFESQRAEQAENADRGHHSRIDPDPDQDENDVALEAAAQDDDDTVVTSNDHDEIAAFAEEEPERPTNALGRTIDGLRRDGAYLPAWDRLGVPEFIAWLEEGAPDDAVHTFAEQSDGTAAGWFARFLGQVSALRLGALAPADSASSRGTANGHRLPSGHALADLSPASVALHERAVRRLRAEPSLSYTDALRQESAAPAF